ncbi:hypothetical protein DL96DRAFT_1555866 [Flagelloscypha sp. PMI_526]|nr:hypothetical protein DL96DRAFT_1555866 [Flagelloscypha sp. PMI_526]
MSLDAGGESSVPSGSTDRSLRRVKSEGDVQPTPSSSPILQFPSPAMTSPAALPPEELARPPTSFTPIQLPQGIPQSVANNAQAQAQAEEADPPRLNISVIRRGMNWMGIGGSATKSRKLISNLIWSSGWASAQVLTIVVVLAATGGKTSPTKPPLNEWHACERPLGAWACLWIGRCFLATSVSFWSYKRQMMRLRQNGELLSDLRVELESGGTNQTNSASLRSPTERTAANATAQTQRPAAPANQTRRQRRASERENQPPLPHAKAFARLSTLSSLITISWFITAHILEYTSMDTCRHASPHLWWLIFSILALMYLMVLEVVILGFFFFIILPVAFTPHVNPSAIKPDIDKLPKSIVDRIPLVMYMPFPPDAPEEERIKTPEAIYTYPPKSGQPTPDTKPTSKRRRFRFLRLKRSKKQGSGEDVKLPFVMLEGNRAICSICLCDFEEMPNEDEQKEEKDKGKNKEEAPAVPTQLPTTAVPVEEVVEESRENRQLELVDAGEGAQPLRLLACGHVFHKTCLDPWLTDVSGRCPVCQRKVELPEEGKKKKARET